MSYYVFADWVDEALRELTFLIQHTKLTKDQLDVIYSEMIMLSGKMITVYLENVDEQLLGQIEVMQELMGKVKELRKTA